MEQLNANGLPLRRMVAISLGNALEFYDFMIFSFFALQIGHAMVPTQFEKHGLVLALATFGVGFFTRPLGAIVIGRYADRHGRKPAMMWSFALMGIAMLGTALTPPYASIGVAAPVLLLLCRLLQGFAIGGEVGPITAYAAEAGVVSRPIETRFVLWFNGNGIVEKYWIPREDGADYEMTP